MRVPSDLLLQRYAEVRAQTERLAEPLSAEDCCVQSMPDASPVKWHLAHTSWFFETFVLERFAADFQPWQVDFRVLFNSYYNGVGQKHPRAQRGLLTRPRLDEVLAYREHVDRCMRGLLATAASTELLSLIELGLQHEQQHQELLLTDCKHLLSCSPLLPAYTPAPELPLSSSVTLTWLPFAAELVAVGHTGESFCYDNETPRHRQFVEAFALASRLVANAEYADFIADGGYRRPELWLAEGWDWLQAGAITHPLYWREGGEGGWQEFTLHGLQPLHPPRPAAHLSYYEADAYARWAGARLPTEAEWERAAAHAGVDTSAWLHPQAATEAGLSQLFASLWQWTSSSYAPYPGYQPAAGAVGEYNGKFMVNQYVLRGSSCATPIGHARASYRNFFPASARWQFTGIRLAR